MKYLGLIILVFLLAFLQTRTHAQTASSTPVSKYYSTLVKEKLAAGQHPAPANPADKLPGDNELPKKVKEMAAGVHPNSGGSQKNKLPGNAPLNVDELRSRNQKWIDRKEQS